MGAEGASRRRSVLCGLSAKISLSAVPIEADPASIGVLSKEACAVALLLGRLDLLNDYKRPLDALELIGHEWEKTVRDPHSIGWRQ